MKAFATEALKFVAFWGLMGLGIALLIEDDFRAHLKRLRRAALHYEQNLKVVKP